MKRVVSGAETITPEVADILARRAERIRVKRIEQEVEAEAMLWVAEIGVGEEVYAFPLHAIRAALPLRMVSPVPLAPAHVLGMLRFRGELIVALSLESLLGIRGWATDPAVLVVVEVERRLVAFDCEAIPKASKISISAVEEARARAAGEVVVNVTTRDMRAVHLVHDLPRLLRLGDGEARRAD